MDDYSLASLNDSKNEWCARLINTMTPHFSTGIQSIYNESLSICEKNKETNKYLMTFQNFLSRIPHWNNNIIESESERIVEASDCSYLEDMITCIHIIQLKMLSCMRVSHVNKKINVNIPSLDQFVHAVYINIARKVYDNIYLFEEKVEPLTRQKNVHEVELIVREAIINTVRDNIPVAELLRIFLDESEEHDVETEMRSIEPEEDVKEPESESGFKSESEPGPESEPQPESEPVFGMESSPEQGVVDNVEEPTVVKKEVEDISSPIDSGSSSIKFADIVERQDENGKVDTQPLDGEPKAAAAAASADSSSGEEISLKIDSGPELNTELDIVEVL